jgi:hypothetical protein
LGEKAIRHPHDIRTLKAYLEHEKSALQKEEENIESSGFITTSIL